MRSPFFFFLLCLSSFSADSQTARFRTISLHEEGVELKFPIIILPDSAVARKINSYLQISMLGRTTQAAPGSRVFDKVKWTHAQSGMDELDYTVLTNNGKALSIAFDGEGLGAHPSPFQEYMQFNVQNGEPIFAGRNSLRSSNRCAAPSARSRWSCN